MKVIQAHAHILTDAGVNAVGVTASLEIYILSSRRWIKIATAKSSAKGLWRATFSRVKAGAFYAPMLRLTEPGTPTPRVLAQGGYVNYNSSTLVLNVDFGKVERLADTAYHLTASTSLFSRSKQTIAGQAKKAKVSIALLLRDSNIGLAGATTIKRSPVLDTFDAEIIKFKSNEAKLQSQIAQKDRLFAIRNVELKETKGEVLELEEKLSRSIESEKKLKKENETFVVEAKQKAPISEIAANIGTEVDAANRKLRDEKRPYQFGRIELDLRGAISNDGRSMALGALADMKKIGSGVSSSIVKIEMLPERAPSEVSTSVKAPDVTGLTETAVRRLLQAVGLRLEGISKSVSPASGIPVGQSLQQSPKAGADLARGSTVLVVFAAQTPDEE